MGNLSVAGAHDASRFGALDGLRGWAALSVVISHCVYETFRHRFPEFNNLGLTFIGNGTFDVGVFLAISGYVLTIRRWYNPANPPLFVAIARRYIRLTIPIFSAVMLTWLVMAVGLTPTKSAPFTIDEGWYWEIVRFDPDFLRALWFSFAGAYVFEAVHNYNPPLWTMLIELWGAFVIFAISQSGRFFRDAYMPVLFITALLLFVHPIASCFFFGALVALAERDGFVLKPGRLLDAAATLVFFGSILAAAFVLMIHKDMSLLAIFAATTFLGARYSEPVKWFLNLPVSQFMGLISFPLYLIQYAIMLAFSPRVILWTDGAGMLNTWTAAAIGIASVMLCLIVATLFVPIETGTLALLRRIDRFLASRTLPVAARAQV